MRRLTYTKEKEQKAGTRRVGLKNKHKNHLLGVKEKNNNLKKNNLRPNTLGDNYI